MLKQFFRHTSIHHQGDLMKTVKEKRSKSNVKDRVAAYTELVGGDCGFDSRLLLIQQLIPIGLMAVEEALQEEVSRMVGERHSREGSLKRCGSNPGRCFCAIKTFRSGASCPGYRQELGNGTGKLPTTPIAKNRG
jgi:hypothetical protein